MDEDHLHSFPGIGTNQCSENSKANAIKPYSTSIDSSNILNNYNIMAGAGDFYAVRPLKALGIDPEEGVVRLSFVHYTSENEVTKLINSLDKVL